jgi:hypothetical protein
MQRPKERWWSEVVTRLRAIVVEDEGVLILLDAYEHGRVDRRDVMAFTGRSAVRRTRSSTSDPRTSIRARSIA